MNELSDEIDESESSGDPDDLLGGLDVNTSADISVPNRLIEQVIGQDHARDVVRKAAKQKRHVLMIGSPGTGKSMLSKAMAELMPSDNFQDVLLYPNEDDDTEPQTRVVPAGKGEQIVEAHKQEAESINRRRQIIVGIIALIVAGYSIFTGQLLLGLIGVILLVLAYKFILGDAKDNGPELLIDRSDSDTAPFKDATGAHSGALLGDVRHDPYQSGQMATSAHKRVESGKIHESHRGVLFIDEINTLDISDQQKLMTAIQEGEFSITGQSERSSGAMVQTEPVPCDFVMVAAGNMDAMENMHPALRSRLQGYGYEVYMDDTIEDTAENRQKFAQFVAQEVENDDHIPHFTRDAIEEIVKEAQRMSGEKGKLTLKLRELGGLVRDAGDIAVFGRPRDESITMEDISEEHTPKLVTRDDVLQAKATSKSIEQQVVDKQMEKKERYRSDETDSKKVGQVNGLAVMGEDSGIMLPVVGTVTPAQGEGEVIATGKLQEIAQEAVQNVSALVKKVSGQTLDDKDIHIQFVQTYEGVDGDSASVTVATAIISALTGTPIRQDLAMTGSLSVQGEVLPVGGVTHKIEAAAKSGIKTVLIPEQNKDDVLIEDEYKDQIDIITVSHLGDVLEHALVDNSNNLHEFVSRLKSESDSGVFSLDELNTPSSLISTDNS